MMSHPTSVMTDLAPAGRSVWREERSGLSGFGGRPVLHEAWREPAPESSRSRRVVQAVVVELAGFRAAA